jgi:hypothetical protein
MAASFHKNQQDMPGQQNVAAFAKKALIKPQSNK